jgi:hypothetical protein
MIITPIVAPTLSGLTATPAIRGNLLTWNALFDSTLFSVEIWAASVNNRASSSRIATVTTNSFMHLTTAGATWYYWIRAVSTFQRADGAWFPVSATGGVSSTSLLTTTSDIGLNAVTSIDLFQANTVISQTVYATWESILAFSYPGTGNNFIIDIQHLTNFSLLAIGTSQSAYALQRLSLVENTVYTTGTVSVTNGSAIVTGVGTLWVGNLVAGQVFFLPGGNRYTIQSVDSNTQITLTVPYPAATQSGKSYYVIQSGINISTLTQTPDKFVINGSYCLTYSFPFRYRIPATSTVGKLYDVLLDWAMVRDNATWSISNSSILRTVILEEVKR